MCNQVRINRLAPHTLLNKLTAVRGKFNNFHPLSLGILCTVAGRQRLTQRKKQATMGNEASASATASSSPSSCSPSSSSHHNAIPTHRLFSPPYPGFFPAFPASASNFGIFGWIPAPGLSLMTPQPGVPPFRGPNVDESSTRSEVLNAWNPRRASSPPASPLSTTGS